MEKIPWRVLPGLCHPSQVRLCMEHALDHPGCRKFQLSLTGLAFLANDLWVQFYSIGKMSLHLYFLLIPPGKIMLGRKKEIPEKVGANSLPST